MGVIAPNSTTAKAETRLTVSEFAALLGMQESVIRERIARVHTPEYFSISELANRWRCSRGTVYNRLRSIGAKVLDFGVQGKKSKKAVPAQVVRQIEAQKTKRLC